MATLDAIATVANSAMPSWLTVAIAGVTCAGKTNVSRKLKEVFPSAVVFCQDDYFLPQDDARHVRIPELDHMNWDILSSIDMGRLLQQLRSLLSQEPATAPGIVIVEGNLVLNYTPVAELCQQKYYFVLNKSDCWERRRLRTYDPPDPPEYFEKCVWPMYEMYKEDVKNLDDVVYVDGALDQETTFQQILADIQRLANVHGT